MTQIDQAIFSLRQGKVANSLLRLVGVVLGKSTGLFDAIAPTDEIFRLGGIISHFSLEFQQLPLRRDLPGRDLLLLEIVGPPMDPARRGSSTRTTAAR